MIRVILYMYGVRIMFYIDKYIVRKVFTLYYLVLVLSYDYCEVVTVELVVCL